MWEDETETVKCELTVSCEVTLSNCECLCSVLAPRHRHLRGLHSLSCLWLTFAGEVIDCEGLGSLRRRLATCRWRAWSVECWALAVAGGAVV